MSAFGTFRKAKNLLAHGSWVKELCLLAAPGTDQEMVKKTVTPTSTGVVRRLISYSSFIQGFQFVNAQAVMKPLSICVCIINANWNYCSFGVVHGTWWWAGSAQTGTDRAICPSNTAIGKGRQEGTLIGFSFYAYTAVFIRLKSTSRYQPIDRLIPAAAKLTLAGTLTGNILTTNPHCVNQLAKIHLLNLRI